jgi:hypothetical protein
VPNGAPAASSSVACACARIPMKRGRVKSENPRYVVMTAAIGHDDRNQQKDNNYEQDPTWTQRKWFRQCQVHTGGSQHRYECRPAGFTDNLIAHTGAAKESASSLIQLSPRSAMYTQEWLPTIWCNLSSLHFLFSTSRQGRREPNVNGDDGTNELPSRSLPCTLQNGKRQLGLS